MRAVLLLGLASIALAGCTTPELSEAGNEVALNALTFSPRDITVAAGDYVTFNVLEASHTVDFSEGEMLVSGVTKSHSGNLNPGESWTVQFTEPGTYQYFCRYHSSLQGGERIGMIGTITVI